MNSHPRTHLRMSAPRRFAPRGFTLVEMVVAIGIIVLLAALTITASLALVERSEVRQTQSRLQLLDLALSEWETQAERKLRWGDPNAVFNIDYDIRPTTPHVWSASELLDAIGRSAEVTPILAQIESDAVLIFADEMAVLPPTFNDPDDAAGRDPNVGQIQSWFTTHFVDNPGRDLTAVLDSWGKPIRAIHPGRVADEINFGDILADADDDGTIFLDATFNDSERVYGRARSRQVCFVSAGPDGRFGDVSDVNGSEQREFARDNVYSYDVDEVTP